MKTTKVSPGIYRILLESMYMKQGLHTNDNIIGGILVYHGQKPEYIQMQVQTSMCDYCGTHEFQESRCINCGAPE